MLSHASPSAGPARPPVAQVAGKAIRGAVTLGLRQVLVQGMNVGGGIVLARLLSPTQFGLYAVITFVMGFLTAFGDAGFGASLIRQQEEPAHEDYRAVFTVQQIMVLTVVLIAWCIAPQLGKVYGLPANELWLFRLPAVALFLTSLQVIPSIKLERHLAFDKLAVIEVLQAFAFHAVAIVLAWRGVGPLSFGIALIARTLTGAVLANVINPWAISLRWDWPRIRGHLAFGLPYQGTSILSLIKDSITPVFVGMLLGAVHVGYINWAQMVAAYPVLALMVLQRLYLPVFARVQGDKGGLALVLTQVLRATNALVAPLAIVTLVLISPITRLVFGEKWLTALPLFYVLWGANLFVPTAAPIIGLLNSLGLSKTTFSFSAIWMVATWILGIPLIYLYGPLGFAIANLGVQFTNIALFRLAKVHVSLSIPRVVLPVWAAASVVGCAMLLFQRFLPVSTFTAVFGYVLCGLLAYAVLLMAIYPADANKLWLAIRRKRYHPVSQS